MGLQQKLLDTNFMLESTVNHRAYFLQTRNICYRQKLMYEQHVTQRFYSVGDTIRPAIDDVGFPPTGEHTCI